MFLPRPDLSTPWIAFQGTIDRVCDPEAVSAFAREIPSARCILLDKVGHGFSVEKNWLPQFHAAFRDLAGKPDAAMSVRITGDTTPADIAGLPVVEVPARGKQNDLCAIILSGDGGWAGIDKELADVLSGKGIPVAGLNSLQYFWDARTPEQTADAVERMIRHYLAVWKKTHVVLIGYSFGADVLPFVAARLSAEYAGTVKLLAFLGLSPEADFQFHVTGWLGGTSKDALPVLPEIEKLRGRRMIAMYGTEEKNSMARDLKRAGVRLVAFAGGHHMGGKYTAVADTILGAIED